MVTTAQCKANSHWLLVNDNRLLAANDPKVSGAHRLPARRSCVVADPAAYQARRRLVVARYGDERMARERAGIVLMFALALDISTDGVAVTQGSPGTRHCDVVLPIALDTLGEHLLHLLGQNWLEPRRAFQMVCVASLAVT